MANKYVLKLVLSDGTTVEAGVIEIPDYRLTAEDKAEIVQSVLAELQAAQPNTIE